MDEQVSSILLIVRRHDFLVSGFNVFPNEVEEVVCFTSKGDRSRGSRVPNDASGELVKVFCGGER
jgi:long-chain acyl-CoA synthetase